jgi:uncharacterized protein
MSDPRSRPVTVFHGQRMLSFGPFTEIALTLKAALDTGAWGDVLVFDDATGEVIDLDLRGSEAEILARLSASFAPQPDAPSADSGDPAAPRGRGRPKLGVVAREVTLLPRHWEWLGAQPGGASAVLRRLVDQARKTGGEQQARRAAQEAAYRVMRALAGDLAGYEEATRALFAGDRPAMAEIIAAWPDDIRTYALRLAFGDTDPVL